MEDSECALVDRVFTRIIYTETDEALQAALHKYLTPLLLKLASPNEEVRKKVMEVLTHVNKRLKSRPLVTLPVDNLLSQYLDPDGPSMVTNFSMVYIKKGFPRLAAADQIKIVPRLLNLLHSKPVPQQQIFITLLLPSMESIEYPTDIVKRREVFALEDHPQVRSLLISYMLDILKMPYSTYYAPPDTLRTANYPKCPPCYSEISFKRIQAISNDYPNADHVESLKLGVTRYLAAEVFPVKEVSVHLILASADSRHRVVTLGEDAIRRASSEIGWEDPEFIKTLVMMYLGQTQEMKAGKMVALPRERIVLPAQTRIKAKLFNFLMKSKYAAQIFPQNLQIACDALAGPDTKAKLKKYGIEYIARMADHALPHHLKAIAPTLMTYMWKVVEEVTNSSDLRILTYSTVAKLVSVLPALVYDNLNIVEKLFNRLLKEFEKHTRASIHSALITLTPALGKARQDVKERIEKLLVANMNSTDDGVRRTSIHMIHHVYHTSWISTRYLLLLGCADPLPDIREQAKSFLHTKRQVQVPGAEQSFDLELYPTFEEMSEYLEKKANERKRDNKTVDRGSTSLAFKPESVIQMVRYLRTCLARSCGIKNPHVTEVSSWMEQAPIIALFNECISKRVAGQDNPPIKQHKLAAEANGGVHSSLTYYCRLLIQAIELQTTADTVYLLLELVSTNTGLAKQLIDWSKVVWCKGLVNHYDPVVQRYAAQLLAAMIIEADCEPLTELEQYIERFNEPSVKVEQQNGSLYAMCGFISYHYNNTGAGGDADKWAALIAKVVKLIEPLLHEKSKAEHALLGLQQISLSGPLCIEYGSADGMDGELSVYNIIKLLSERVKSSKLDSKQRERVATCLGSIGAGDPDFPHRKICMDGLFESSSTKELELHFTVGQALMMSAQGLDCADRRNKWRQSEADFWTNHTISSEGNAMAYLVESILDKYICHINPHIKQAACVWLLTAIKNSSQFTEVTSRSGDMQAAFMRLLTENDEITQDVASKGLALVYDNSDDKEQKELISNLVDTLMTGKSGQKKSGEVSGETKLFSEGSLGSTPDGQGINTYRELCAIATDLNQPDLIYKFLHLANHQSMWNSRKGAAFGFSTIAAQAGEQLAPFISQIVPRLYRYTFDPNIKIQTAMRGIWNAVVKESKSTVDKYVREILDDLLANLTNTQWRVRESCCLAVSDLLKGRQLDDVLDKMPELWSIMLRLLDDIKESTRMAATTATTTLTKATIKTCDITYSKSGERALSLLLPVLLSEGITSTVTDIRNMCLETVVSMSKNAGAFLKPHIHTLVPIMLESLSGLEPRSLNYLALRVSGHEDAEQKLDKARVAASKMSPMMDSINLCVQQVDGDVLPNLIPRLIDLIKSGIGLGTKVGIATVISSICLKCGLQSMQPFAGKCMKALVNGLSDRNMTVRRNYSTCLANVCKTAKDSSVENLIQKLRGWYMEKHDDTLIVTCGMVLKAMSDVCPDTLNRHKTRVLPLIFLAMHKVDIQEIGEGASSPRKHSSKEQVWSEIWAEVTIGNSSAVRLYIEEFIALTSTALQSNSWHMKAQAAVAMGTIAQSAGENMSVEHLNKLVSVLLSGLTGRTWNGKEELLSALATVVQAHSATLLSADCPINTDDILTTCLREASKESLTYKIPALVCLSKVLESLKIDGYTDLYRIVLPYLSIDKHEDEEVSIRLLIEFRETAFQVIGRAWPTEKHKSTQDSCIVDTSRLLLSRLPLVTWREQLSIWHSLITIIKRTSLKDVEIKDVASPWSLKAFTDHLVETAIASGCESRYSSIRLAGCSAIKHTLLSVKGVSSDIPSEKVRGRLLQYITESSVNDSHVDVKELATELQDLLSSMDK